MTASWISQKVPALGAIKAEGIRNQLGRPNLDRLTVLVREAAQNSWDAADDGRIGPVRFEMDLRRLPADLVRRWRATLEQNAPAEGHLPLLSALASEDLSILFVSDRGTEGLGGPTRGNQASKDVPHDYVSFVLNVGDPRDTEFGGGTYGFGKTVFYLGSRAATIVVYTRCRDEHGQVETRLVGCALGPSFDAAGEAYTGRHWFGLHGGEEQAVEPLRGEAADEVAASLGFPQFEGAELGTSIAVVAPELDSRTPEEACSRLAESVLWHLWPKMLDQGDGAPAMRFGVSLDGARVELPDPRIHPVLREFVAALRELESGQVITHGKAGRAVGRLKLRTTFAPPPAVDDTAHEAGLGAGVRHCCLMRMPELVVEYREGPAMPDQRVWYAGVFKVLPELDETFAAAEPPTHDAWVAANLTDRDRSVVKVTLRKLDDALRDHATPAQSGEEGGGAAEGLAAASRLLGSLLAPAGGDGAGPRKPGKSGGGRRSRVKMSGDPQWVEFEGQAALAQPFEVDADRPVTVDVAATVRVWGGGGNETEPPVGSKAPEVLGWRSPEGGFHPPGRLSIRRGEGGRWEALVRAPDDTVTRVRVFEASEDVIDG